MKLFPRKNSRLKSKTVTEDSERKSAISGRKKALTQVQLGENSIQSTILSSKYQLFHKFANVGLKNVRLLSLWQP